MANLDPGWPRIDQSDRCEAAVCTAVDRKTKLSENQGFSRPPVSASQADDAGPSLVLVSRSEIFQLLVRDLGTNRSVL